MRGDFPRRTRRLLINVTSALLLLLLIIQSSSGISNIDHLEGNAGFRQAQLQWKYPASSRIPISFRIRYCEQHPWGLHRCRYQVVDETTGRTGRQETKESNEVFVIEIGGLRMATNYTFQVVPQVEDTVHKFGGRPSQISLQTKGFSAKATNCLADSSEVVVETGPFFGGRISVEDSSRCFVKGDAKSPQTKYTLRIRHHECGSIINGSKVTTVILVQENVPILTHSTRRFVVVCSFSPESFIVQAGVTLPRETSVAKSLDFSRLIRLAPQSSNLLNSEVASPLLQDENSNAENQMKMDGGGARAHLGNETLNKGSLETLLVFGMICIAIVASIASVIWFIKSYQTSSLGRRDETQDDNESFSNENPYSDSESSKESDTRSDFEVELDFEFSEESHEQTTPVSASRSQSSSSSSPRPNPFPNGGPSSSFA